MKKKRKSPKTPDGTGDSVARAVAKGVGVAEGGGPRTETYFAAIDTGLYGWLREEEQAASTPDRTGGLSEAQRAVLEVALGIIRRHARASQRAAVFATTAHVEDVLTRTGRKARAKDIFLGWKHRIGEADGTRPFQAVDLGLENQLLVILEISGSSGRREIRAHVAIAHEDGAAWRMHVVEPPPGDELLVPITRVTRPEHDGLTRSAAQTLYEALKVKEHGAAERFIEFCERERIRILAWLRAVVSSRRKIRRGFVDVVQVGDTLVVMSAHGEFNPPVSTDPLSLAEAARSGAHGERLAIDPETRALLEADANLDPKKENGL